MPDIVEESEARTVGVFEKEGDRVGDLVAVFVEVAVLLGVTLIDCMDGDARLVAVLDGVHPQSNCEDTGTKVTPRNTVLTAAVATLLDLRVAVLKLYSVEFDVRYRVNTPHISMRPAMEIILDPFCSSCDAAGETRDQEFEVDCSYFAKLVLERYAVSVIHTFPELSNTNPYGM